MGWSADTAEWSTCGKCLALSQTTTRYKTTIKSHQIDSILLNWLHWLTNRPFRDDLHFIVTLTFVATTWGTIACWGYCVAIGRLSVDTSRIRIRAAGSCTMRRIRCRKAAILTEKGTPHFWGLTVAQVLVEQFMARLLRNIPSSTSSHHDSLFSSWWLYFLFQC
jgi:hypothetical protein